MAAKTVTHQGGDTQGCCEMLQHLAAALCACCCQEQCCTDSTQKQVCCDCKAATLAAIDACVACLKACC